MEKDVVRDSLERWRACESADSPNRHRALQDQEFYAGRHWSPRAIKERELDDRPILTIDRLKPAVNQIVNDVIRGRPQAKVMPVDDVSDPPTARIVQAYVKTVERNSNADIAYAHAVRRACITGCGWLRVDRQYVSHRSLDQEHVIRRVADEFSVYSDPNAEEFDHSDSDYQFIVEDIPEYEYKLRFPEATQTAASVFTTVGNLPNKWLGAAGTIRVAEHWWAELEPVELAIISLGYDPRTMTVPVGQVESFRDRGFDPTVHREGTVYRRRIKHALINGIEILEGAEDGKDGAIEPGEYCPLVPVVYEEVRSVHSGTSGTNVFRVGIVHTAKDAQRAYNYAATNMIETSLLAPRAPIFAATGQISETQRPKWEQAHRRNFAVLEYEPVVVDVDGRPAVAPPPSWQSGNPELSGLALLKSQFSEDLKSTTSRHDASLGQRGPQESAKAIQARQGQDQLSTLHAMDHLGWAIRHVARIIVSQMPEVIDSERIMRIMGTDEQSTISVRVSPGHRNRNKEEQTAEREQLPEGVQEVFDPDLGRYDVGISVGPGYQTRRQEAAAQMSQFVQHYPQLLSDYGHILFSYLDWPGSDALAEHSKFLAARRGLLPEQIEGKDLPPEIAGALAKLQDKIKEQTKQIQELELDKAGDRERGKATITAKQIDAAARERVAERQADVDLEQTRMRVEGNQQDAERTAAQDSDQTDSEHDHEMAMATLQAAIERALVILKGSEDRKTAKAAAPAGDGKGDKPKKK